MHVVSSESRLLFTTKFMPAQQVSCACTAAAEQAVGSGQRLQYFFPVVEINSVCDTPQQMCYRVIGYCTAIHHTVVM